MSKAKDEAALVQTWREMGPVKWAESQRGWTDVTGDPIVLAPWQKAVLNVWDERREEIVVLAISCVKKSGKTLTNALLLAWRWLALPGQHFAVGNDLDQSAGRQFQEIADMVRRNPYLRKNVKVTGKVLTFLPTGSTIEALAVDAAGNAGANHLTASHTEAWGIIQEAGIRAYEELTPPPGRFYGLPALRIMDSYAGYIGESETWHDTVDRGLAGERVDEAWPIFQSGGLLLFHDDGEQAQARCFRGTTEDAVVYYAEQRKALREGAFLRLHANKRSTGREEFISLEEWDACVGDDHHPVRPDGGLSVYVGVDASVKHDASAALAVYYDEDDVIRLARHRTWQPTPGEPLDLDATIGAFLLELDGWYSVRAVYYDPFQMHSVATRLGDRLPMIEYPQSNKNLTVMGQGLFELIRSRGLVLYPSAEMRKAASQTVAVKTPQGHRIAKEKAVHKIDLIVALAMACQAAVDYADDWVWTGG